MAQLFKIALWNANGITNHKHEVELFLTFNKIDILLISESHLTTNTSFKIPQYIIYNAAHPDTERRASAGAAIIIRNGIKHHMLDKVEEACLQAASIVLEDWHGPITVSAAYCPPNYPADKQIFINYFTQLVHRFLARCDYNVKHVSWGSRLPAPERGKILHAVINELHLNHLS